MNRKLKISKEVLVEYYVNSDKTVAEISELLNVSVMTIYNSIKRFKIKKRDDIYKEDMSDLLKEAYDKGLSSRKVSEETGFSASFIRKKSKGLKKKFSRSEEILTKEFLIEEFTNKGKRAQDIGEETGFSYGTVQRALTKFGIRRRECISAQLTKEKFIELYIDKNIGITEIALMFGFQTLKKIKELMKEWDIPFRVGYTKKQRESTNKRRKHDHIYYAYFHSYYDGARKRDLEFSISIDYVWDLFLKQDKKCKLSGLDITIPMNDKEYSSYTFTASIDRIDSSKGYTEDNIQFVHKKINMMKSNLPQDEFIFFCTSISEHNKG